MKFTLPISLLAIAVSVDAAAVLDHDKRYCSAEGQACDTVKRAADAFANAIAENDKLITRDETNGESSFIATRQLHELALAVAATQEDPDAYYGSLTPTRTAGDKATEKREAEPWCTRFLGQPCWAKRDQPTQVKRVAEPWCTRFLGQPCWAKREEDPTPAKRDEATQVKREAEPWCTRFLGQPCWAKREVVEHPTPAKRDEATPVKREAEPWCTRFLGQPCWAKRGAAPEPEPDMCAVANGQPCWTHVTRSEGSDVEKREAGAHCSRFTGSSCWKRDESATALEEAKRCTSEGQACWKAKRAAAAVISAIEQGNALKMARDADPEYCARSFDMPCWKRAATCNGPSGVCTKATRDLHAMYNAARSIVEA